MITSFNDLPLPDLANTRFRHRPYATDEFIVNAVIKRIWLNDGYSNWYLPITGSRNHLVRMYNGGRLNLSYPPSGMISLNDPLYPADQEITFEMLSKHSKENWLHKKFTELYGDLDERHRPLDWNRALLKRVFRSTFEEWPVGDAPIKDINAKLDIWQSLTHVHVFPIIVNGGFGLPEYHHWCMALYISDDDKYFTPAWENAVVLGKRDMGIHPYAVYEALTKPISLIGIEDEEQG